MKKVILAAATVAATWSAGAASATVLTFDSARDCATTEVVITAGAAGDACLVPPSAGPNGTPALVRSNGPTDSFWTATFTGLAEGVSIQLGDFGVDEDRLFLSGFDSSGALLETTTWDTTVADSGMTILRLNATGIASLTFGVTGDLGNGGIYADNLTFTTSAVPLPATGLLLLGGLGGLAALRRRKKS